MEAFTLLKYWHTLFAGDTTCPAAPKVISDGGDGGDDDGPFFDLVFSLTALEYDKWEVNPETESESGAEEESSDNMDCLEFVPENHCPIERNDNETSKGSPVSLFSRENNPRKDSDSNSNPNSGSDERRQRKEVVHKYLKMIKPSYAIERMKYGSGRVRFPVVVGGGSTSPPWQREGKKGMEEVPIHRRHGNGNNLESGLKVVMKHLGKSRSSSALVAAPCGGGGRRSDDSLVEVQDGIQGAILYCKRSYSMPTPRVDHS